MVRVRCMAGWRGGSPRLGALSPRLACMVLGSRLRISAVSGGNSTRRNTEPLRGGWMPMSTAARSPLPVMSAGDWSVTQITRDTVCACGRTRLCGLGPSNRTTALSFLSTVVTTRRTFALRAIVRFPPGCGWQALYRLGVDQHERQSGRRVGAVAPGVVGAALDQHVA